MLLRMTKQLKRTRSEGTQSSQGSQGGWKKFKVNRALSAAGGNVYARSKGLGPEKKGYDTGMSLAGITNTTNSGADAYTLNIPRVGANSYQRVGRKIALHSLRIRGEFMTEFDISAGTVDTCSVRMLVVWDKHGNGAGQLDQIIGRTDQTGAESATVLDPVRYDNIDRFVILRDVVVPMNCASGTVGGAGATLSYTQCFDEYISLKGLISSCDGDSGFASDISSGGLQVFFRVTDTAPGVTYVRNAVARLRCYG